MNINATEILNQATITGAKIAKSVANIWNTSISSALKDYLNRVGNIPWSDIAARSASALSTLKECAAEAIRFAMPLAKLLAGKVVEFGKSVVPLAVAHPVIATAFALVFVVIPVFREYCAANDKFTLKAPLVMTWMIITRPFRLVYRMLTVITGGTEVDRLKLTKAQQRIAQLEGRINQLRGLNDMDCELHSKGNAVFRAIERLTNNDLKTILGNAFTGVVRDVDDTPDTLKRSTYQTSWNYLQQVIRENARVNGIDAVKRAIDEWKQCLDLSIESR